MDDTWRSPHLPSHSSDVADAVRNVPLRSCQIPRHIWTLLEVYGHHHPDFQNKIAKATGRRKEEPNLRLIVGARF